MFLVVVTVLFGLLATSRAASSHPGILNTGVVLPTNPEFSLVMHLNGEYVPVEAVDLGGDALFLQAADSDLFTGTPAYVNTSLSASPNDYFPDALVLDLTNNTDNIGPGVYGVFVVELGDTHGAVAYVTAFWGEQQFDFLVVDGAVHHRLTAAPQSWFACSPPSNTKVTGVFLSWGLFATNGSAPWGCKATRVLQKFDIPGGAKSGAG